VSEQIIAKPVVVTPVAPVGAQNDPGCTTFGPGDGVVGGGDGAGSAVVGGAGAVAGAAGAVVGGAGMVAGGGAGMVAGGGAEMVAGGGAAVGGGVAPTVVGDGAGAAVVAVVEATAAVDFVVVAAAMAVVGVALVGGPRSTTASVGVGWSGPAPAAPDMRINAATGAAILAHKGQPRYRRPARRYHGRATDVGDIGGSTATEPASETCSVPFVPSMRG
jgi:hypothetical protein